MRNSPLEENPSSYKKLKSRVPLLSYQETRVIFPQMSELICLYKHAVCS